LAARDLVCRYCTLSDLSVRAQDFWPLRPSRRGPAPAGAGGAGRRRSADGL